MRKYMMQLLRALRHRPWPRSPAVAARLDPFQLVEEENSPYYDPRHFHTARIGDVLDDRYQLATKLGHGSSSTVWLARDLTQWKWLSERYVAIKIKANSPSLKRFIGDVIPMQMVKILLQMVLHRLDYLHSECHIIHTDLKPDNIMVKLEDPSILERDADDEFMHPLPQKHCEDGRVIYLARNDYGQSRRPIGVIRITDFDLAVLGRISHKGCIQAEIYRAPEVILDAGYTYSADIWSLGVMLWDLLEGKSLFKSEESKEVHEYDDQKHLALITALLGDPPQSLLKQGDRTSLFYDRDGRLHNPDLIPAGFSFETTISNVSGEEKKMFIDFVQKMIRWQPSERSTAKALHKDPWLYKGLCGG